ncbi:MAG: hypothetical protein ACREI4_02720, partial [Candidatus Rokuibacteriota bacterium]
MTRLIASMSRFVAMVGAVTLVASAAMVFEPAVAGQSHPLQPGGPGIQRLEKRPGVIEGKLTRVDGRRESVDVSIGFLGLLGKTLMVNRDTLIEVNGREARFADLQEGAK